MKTELTKEQSQQIDQMTAFLTELQALMRKYDAEIQGDFIEVWIGDTNITYGYCRLTPDNIFDYEK